MRWLILAWRRWPHALGLRHRAAHEERDREVREKKEETLDRIDRLVSEMQEYDRVMKQ